MSARTLIRVQSRVARRFDRDRLLSWLLLLPSVVAVGVFVYGFIAWTAWVSATDWVGIVRSYNFVGLEQYTRLFHTARFQHDLRNSIVFTTFFVGGSLGIGLLLAIFLDRKVFAEGFFRTVYLFPMAVSFVVTGTVWRWIFTPGDPRTGEIGINQLFEILNVSFLQSRWFTDPTVALVLYDGKIKWGIPMALISVIIAALWQMSGFAMAMYLAGLRGISHELREAAAVDGASDFQIYRHVVIPLLTPITVSAAIVLGHISLKIFDLIFIMSGTGPAQATDVPAIYMYETTFRDNRFSQGAAIGIIMLVMIALLIVPYLVRTLKKEEIY